MRVLELHEYAHVTGAGTETLRVYKPPGVTITTQLEPNNSTTITFRSALGTLTWNSGMFVACSTIGAGATLIVTSFSGNPFMGKLASLAASLSCSSTFTIDDEDGDEYGMPE